MELKTDCHHLNWTRADHNKMRVTKLVRDHELMKEQMVIGVHRELHKYIEPVAPPSIEIARYILGRLREMPTLYTPIDAVKALRDELYEDAPKTSEHYAVQLPFLELSRKALARRVL